MFRVSPAEAPDCGGGGRDGLRVQSEPEPIRHRLHQRQRDQRESHHGVRPPLRSGGLRRGERRPHPHRDLRRM